MRTFTLQFFLQAYSDQNPSNSPSMSNFKWNRPINGLAVEEAESRTIDLAPGESQTIFSRNRTLSQDGSTTYSISLKPLTQNTYVLAWDGGTAPAFRVQRNIGIDATTQVTATVNGPVVTFTSPAGTPFSLGSVQIGDNVKIGNLFSILNQGVFQIISKTSSSFSVEIDTGVSEGPITLGSGFADQVNIFGAAGVQIGDTLQISSGFSPASYGNYLITQVYANSLEFSSVGQLPTESHINTQVAVYESAVSFLYLESDQQTAISINGGATEVVRPFVRLSNTMPGIFARTDIIYSLSITNTSLSPSRIWMAFVG